MRLEKMPKTGKSGKKRRGRGYGSGRGGHTTGRGAKGAKARGKVGLTFAGTKIKKSLIQRLPLRRGKGKFKPLKPSPLVVNLKHLSLLPKGTTVDAERLIKEGIVDGGDARRFGVKILGEGELKNPLRVALPTSKSAAAKIEKAGGKVVSPKEIEQMKETKETKEIKAEEKKAEKKAPPAAKKSAKKVTKEKPVTKTRAKKTTKKPKLTAKKSVRKKS